MKAHHKIVQFRLDDFMIIFYNYSLFYCLEFF